MRRTVVLHGFPIGAALIAASVMTFGSVSLAYGASLPAHQEAVDDQALPLAALLEGSGPLSIEGMAIDRAAMLRIYQARNYQSVWEGRDDTAVNLANALAGSAADGIDPDSLGAPTAAAALADPNLPHASRDVLLTALFLDYASAFARGQVDPRSIDSDWVLAPPSFDGAPLVDRIAKGESFAAVTGALAPSDPKYKELRAALARYAHIAADGGWPLVPGLADDSLATGGPRHASAGYAILRHRLAMEGFASEDGDFTAAVRLFQARHGIDVDGKVGPDTLEALNVGAAQRADQLRLALERLRAMPRDWPATRLVVNIPSATLALYRDGKVALTSRVVVGDPNHPTPVLGSAISSVLFNPPWTVPASIVRKEIQPRLVKDPGYLSRNHFKLLGRGDGNSEGIDWGNTDILANGWQVQQQPGPWNALGTLMFDFPSPFAVYLHDTPGRSAFARSDRGLSHGCVRVEAVNALAGAVLGAEASPEAIQKIVAGGQTERHALKQPMPVYLIYLTAFIGDDGAVEFRDDLYGRDQRLAAALSAHKPPEPRVALEQDRIKVDP